MVRNYVRTSNRAKTYTKEELEQAIHEVKRGIITQYRACKKYKIPKMTLNSHIRGIRGQKSKTMGRTTVISAEHESALAAGLKTLEKWGWGLSRKEVLEMVGEFVRKNNIKTPFKNGVPGEDWFLGFKKRHNLSIKKPQSVEYARKKCMDPFLIEEYFQLLETVLKENDLQDKPNRVWNLDETSFCLDPSKSKVVGQKNQASSRTTAGSGRENITVLMTVNSSGEKAPPLIVFKGKNVWNEWMASKDTEFPGTAYVASKNGWMESDIFYNFFKDTFIQLIGPERPVLLIYDGHVSHVDERLIRTAIEENIIILKLPPHSSHLLQPLDVSVFRSLKQSWDTILVQWQRQHQGQKLPKKEFSRLVGKIWMEISGEVIKSGFRKTGIQPFNKNVILPDCYDIQVYKRFLDAKQNQTNNDGNVSNTKEPISTEIPSFSDPQTVTNQPFHGENLYKNPRPSTSGISNLIQNDLANGTTFEELLLNTVKQSKPVQIKPKKRICKGAEIITMRKIEETAQEERSGLEEVQYNDSSSDDDFIKDISENEETEAYVETVSKCVSNISINDWVLVKIAGIKSFKNFVGCVVEVKPIIQVQFLRKVPSLALSSTFARTEEIAPVPIQDIIRVLPRPTECGRRGLLKFEVSFDNYKL